jgi:hypothetical protein
MRLGQREFVGEDFFRFVLVVGDWAEAVDWFRRTRNRNRLACRITILSWLFDVKPGQRGAASVKLIA